MQICDLLFQVSAMKHLKDFYNYLDLGKYYSGLCATGEAEVSRESQGRSIRNSFGFL